MSVRPLRHSTSRAVVGHHRPDNFRRASNSHRLFNMGGTRHQAAPVRRLRLPGATSTQDQRPSRHGDGPRRPGDASERRTHDTLLLGLGVDAVMEDEERQPEDPEGVLGAQLVVLDVHVELFGEAVDRQRRELSGGGSM